MFEIDEGTVSTPTAPCAYAGSEFILNANSEGQAQHHVLPNCDREHCLLQLQAYTQIPSCRKISGGLLAQVALLPRGRRSAQS